MATETLELNTAETDPLLKKGKVPASDNAEKKDEEKDDDMEEKGEEEMTGKNSKSSVKEPVTPISERPTRQRKKTERYISPTPFRSPANKPVSIEQGRGTRLKEIPNVAYKLSKRKPDDNLFLLHTILYGKKGKAQMLKKNIGQFSGFVWSEQEEEKLKTKTKEKLEKCIKEKLIDFCDVLDIPINKSNVKKEELSVRLLEFLVNPKATRDIVLADSETKTKKRKKSTPKNVTSVESSEVPAKKRRQMKISEKKQDPETEEGNEDDGDVGSEEPNDSQGKDDGAPEKETDKNEDTETEDEKDKSAEKNPTDKKSTSKTTKKEKDKPASEEEKSLTKSDRKSSKQVDKSISSSSKKQKVDKDVSSKEKGKKQTSKTQTKRSKDQGTGKTNKKAEKEPTRKELHVVVTKILKEVNFDTATLSDILRNLGSHFGVDLMHRKAEVKDIITAAIKDMSDDDTEEDEGED